jgi:hypothetical protein
MKLLDLLVIYFAIGAPFGVYQITAVRSSLTAHATLGIILRICFWPVFAAQTLIEWFSKDQHSSESNLDRQIDRIRAEIESLVFGNDSISSIFDFREVLYRYAGLSEAANTGVLPDAANEIFEFGNNGDKDVASACLARKNQRKLSFHQSLARNEFVDMIAEFASTGSHRERVLCLAVELANGVNDPKTSDMLAAMMSQSKVTTSGLAIESQTPVIKSRSASLSI